MTKRAALVVGTLGLAAGFMLLPVAIAQIGDEPDAVIEQCLSEGEILKRIEKLTGVTKPDHLSLSCNGEERSAVFKSVDESRRGVSRMQRGGAEFDFTDSYKYERAAYLLDRELGMNMVPVAVIRSHKGDEGTLVAWIDNASHENQMKQRPTGPMMAELARQKGTMKLFDALIFNVDRRPENWMVDNDTAKLYLIDHSRAFRKHKEPSEEFLTGRARLSKELYDKLKALDEAHLSKLLEGLIGQAQIEALLQRRDAIIEKIDRDVEELGEAVVFSG